MKRVLISLVSVLCIVCLAVSLAACGVSAPSYVKNPPKDSADLVAKLEADGWNLNDSNLIEGIGIVFAVKSSTADLTLANVDPNDKVTIETITVYYAGTDALALSFKSAKESGMKNNKKFAPKGVSYNYTISQNGSIVSCYEKMSGKASDFLGGMDFTDFED